MTLRRVLFVDDEPSVLAGIRRQLRNSFDVVTATSGMEALRLIRDDGPFAVVVSDMRMPAMDGARLLSRLKDVAPETVRIMLTGNLDALTAATAINDGEVFRFLTKPIDTDGLSAAVEAGIQQHGLITAERELLSGTLNAAVRVLTDVLALVNPTAFGRAARVGRVVGLLSAGLAPDQRWELDLAAMLSQIGCVTVPEAALARLAAGDHLTKAELAMVAHHPEIGRELISGIPRLEGVAELIGAQEIPAWSPGRPAGAALLKVALDYDLQLSMGRTPGEAIEEMRGRSGIYDPATVTELERVTQPTDVGHMRSLPIEELLPGMVLAEGLNSDDGRLLIAAGQPVTSLLCARIKNYRASRAVSRLAKVHVPPAAESAAA